MSSRVQLCFGTRISERQGKCPPPPTWYPCWHSFLWAQWLVRIATFYSIRCLFGYFFIYSHPREPLRRHCGNCPSCHDRLYDFNLTWATKLWKLSTFQERQPTRPHNTPLLLVRLAFLQVCLSDFFTPFLTTCLRIKLSLWYGIQPILFLWNSIFRVSSICLLSAPYTN